VSNYRYNTIERREAEMNWYTIDLVDPKTNEKMTTQERSTDQCSAEMKAQDRITRDGEDLVVVSKIR
jgi:hypothetical protein